MVKFALHDDAGNALEMARAAQQLAGREEAVLREIMRLHEGGARHRPIGSCDGGKVEAGERPEECLIRELNEELGIVVKEACLAPLTFASHAYPDFHLLMPLYVCRRWDGEVTAREGQKLSWVRPNRLRDYPMPPADVPLVAHLTTLL